MTLDKTIKIKITGSNINNYLKRVIKRKINFLKVIPINHKEVHIIRNIREPLIVEINGKTLSASNKKDTQAILEEEVFDIPKLAVTKMCIISFNAFNSLASMSLGETKQFLDDIFGFKLFLFKIKEKLLNQ